MTNDTSHRAAGPGMEILAPDKDSRDPAAPTVPGVIRSVGRVAKFPATAVIVMDDGTTRTEYLSRLTTREGNPLK